jgi:chromosome segregation ATPase
MAFRTVEDIVKALREHPEWLEEVRRLILTEELLQLPVQFAQLSALVQQLATQVQRLVEQGERHEREIRALRKEFQEHRQEFLQHREEFLQHREEFLQHREEFLQLRAEVEQLRKEFQEHRQEFLQHREEFLQHREEFLQHREEFLQLRAEVEQLRKEFYEHRQEFEAFRQETNLRLYRLERDVAELKGSDRERYYRERASAIFGRFLRRVRLVDFSELYEELDNREPLSDEELLEISQLDAVVEGRRKRDATPVLLAIEASWSLYPDDVERAFTRARIIAKRGFTVYPVVAGKYADEGVIEAANQAGVLVVLDGGRVYGDGTLR